MINAQMEIIIIASITSVACSIPGLYLVLRKMTMLADAVSHSIILGIVLAFFFVKTIDSPILVFAAGMTGVITVLFVEWLNKTGLVKEDAAIGVVYPFMFSVAIVLISLYASEVHIDTDAVLMGELAFAPLNRVELFGVDLGPAAYYQIGGIAMINIILAMLFYKEIKIALFDADYAVTMGMKPKRILYGLMVVVSFTTVVAFEVVGSIMVVGLIVGPAVIAALYTKRLWLMLLLAPLTGIASTLAGYSAAHQFDASIAGSIVTMLGIFFAISLVIAPGNGIIARTLRKKVLYSDNCVNMLLVHLWQHEALGDADDENQQRTIASHLNWEPEMMQAVIRAATGQKYVYIKTNGIIYLLPAGVEKARKALER